MKLSAKNSIGTTRRKFRLLECFSLLVVLATATQWFLFSKASLIVGDSAIEIKEIDQNEPLISTTTSSNQQPQIEHHQHLSQDQRHPPTSQESISDPSLILGTLSDTDVGQNIAKHLSPPTTALSTQSTANDNNDANEQHQKSFRKPNVIQMPPPPPLASSPSQQQNNGDTIADNGGVSSPKDGDGNASESPLHESGVNGKTISGMVVDFELDPAGGHNKAKIKKKKKKKKKMKEEEWKKKKMKKKKMYEEKKKKGMKKHKIEGLKKKKKFGMKLESQKKKGKFNKKKWGKQAKKGKGMKKGDKGQKSLVDKGHKSSGFKTVYHKEEYGQKHKWHDIKRDKKWDSSKKKWKKTWKKEKGKKYKGDHEKKFHKQKKNGKKFMKKAEEKFKKEKKEKFKKGHKKKMEKMSKKKEEGKKKMMKKKKSD